VGQTQDFSLWPISKLGFQELQLPQLEPQPDTTDHLTDILRVPNKTASTSASTGLNRGKALDLGFYHTLKKTESRQSACKKNEPQRRQKCKYCLVHTFYLIVKKQKQS